MFFILKESFRIIKRAGASFTLSLISLTISVVLITTSLLLIQLSDYLQKKIKEDIAINLFLKDNLQMDQINAIKADLLSRQYVKSVEYISKEKAAEIFIKETGEDFGKLLDYNPLPASYTLKLKAIYFRRDTLNKIIGSLSAINGIEDISFKDEYIYKLISILDNIKRYIFIGTIVILLISLYIIYSTVKLIMSSKFSELQTMKLVGARLFTIKLPVILNTIITGLFAGLIADAFFILFITIFDNYINKIDFFGILGYDSLVFALCLGPFLGLLVSILSLRKLTLKI